MQVSEALSGISPNDLPDIESDDEDEEDTSQNDGTQEGKLDLQTVQNCAHKLREIGLLE